MKIMIDPGHDNIVDRGAIAPDGTKEADINLAIANRVYDLLKNYHEVKMTRKWGEAQEVSLQERCDMANNWPADVFVSIHCNNATTPMACGEEVWTSPGQTASDGLADKVVENLLILLEGDNIRRDLSDGDADKEARFKVLVGTNCPAVLVECGFLSNTKDLEFLKSPIGQNTFGYCISTAVLEWGSSRG